MSEGQQEFTEMTAEQVSRGLERFRHGLQCWKCERDGAVHVALCGGYHAQMCINCQNEWHEFIREFWDVVRVSRVKLELEVKVGNDVAVSTAESVMKQEYNIYEISKAWVNNRGMGTFGSVGSKG